MRKRSMIALLTFVVLASPVAAQTAAPQTTAATTPLRIGIYDSRAVALAYYNSDEHRLLRDQMVADLKKATESGDKAKVARIRTKGPALQTLMHQQVFSNLSIPNITPKLTGVFATTAKSKQLALIVSKWDIGYRDPAVEYVDVTADLVQVFKPNDRVQKWLAEMSGKDPLPIDELLSTPSDQ